MVRVESSDEWYLNSARIEPDDLPDTLRAQIGTRKSCIVFFDAEPDVPYADAIRAIDQLNGRRAGWSFSHCKRNGGAFRSKSLFQLPFGTRPVRDGSARVGVLIPT